MKLARRRPNVAVRPLRAGPRTRTLIAFVATRGTLGLMELVFPELTGRWSWSRSRFDSRSKMVIRVLGSRQVGQALVTYVAPEARVTVAGAVVDGIHALSMLGLAARSTRWRRPALVEAAAATGLSVLGIWLGLRRFVGYPAG